MSEVRRGAVRLIRILIWFAVLAPVYGGFGAQAEIVLTDATGREVRLAEPARKLGINEADLILSLALLIDDPVAPVVAWGSPQRLDPGIRTALAKVYPEIVDIPEAGSATPSDFSVEAVVAQSPDLYVIRIHDPGWEPIRKRLEAVGIPVIYLDGPKLAELPPYERVSFSLSLLGDAIGAGDRAGDYAAFVRDRYARVADIVGRTTTRPRVLVDGLATPDCCWVPGQGNRLGELIAYAGGQIVGSEMVPGYAGKISSEYIMAADPQILIATGGPHLAASHGLVLGAGRDSRDARQSLSEVMSTGIRPELTAVREGRAHGILHLLTISPLDVLAVEAFTRWLHPEAAAAIDPTETLAEINRRFLAVPIRGALWASLNREASE